MYVASRLPKASSPGRSFFCETFHISLTPDSFVDYYVGRRDRVLASVRGLAGEQIYHGCFYRVVTDKHSVSESCLRQPSARGFAHVYHG